MTAPPYVAAASRKYRSSAMGFSGNIDGGGKKAAVLHEHGLPILLGFGCTLILASLKQPEAMCSDNAFDNRDPEHSGIKIGLIYLHHVINSEVISSHCRS